MATNTNANIAINIGNDTTEATLIGLRVYNDHSRTQQLAQEINGSTGVSPNNN